MIEFFYFVAHCEGRRKREEGRGKKEEGRRKKEEGRRKREEGRISANDNCQLPTD
ncbi:hypothetical protein QUB60_18725 [Microcoleus sp. A2-C5]|uniref:hypothetical protein n=1 Tax=unclassified Microcoleus TaxID=2642155 RepID=UPI002FD2DDB1